MKRLVWLALTMFVVVALCATLVCAKGEKKQESQSQEKRSDAQKAYQAPPKAAAVQKVSRPEASRPQPVKPGAYGWQPGKNDAPKPPAGAQWQQPAKPGAYGWGQGNNNTPKPPAGAQWQRPENLEAWGWNVKRDQDRKTHPPTAGQIQKIESKPSKPGWGPVYQLPHPQHDDHHGDHHGGRDDHNSYYSYYNYTEYPTYNYYPAPQVYPSAPRYEYYDDDCEYDNRFPPGPHLTGQIIGAEIWAADGVFLGTVGPERQKYESICNPNGPYGSPYSPTSILNPNCPYGAASGPLSAWCPHTTTPPRLFWHGQFVGYLTANRDLHPRTGPGWIMKRWFENRRW